MVGDYRNNFLTNYFSCLRLKMFLGKGDSHSVGQEVSCILWNGGLIILF